MAYNTKYAVNQARQSVAHYSRYAVGKSARAGLKILTGAAAGIGGFSAAATYFTASTVGVIAGIGVSGYLNKKKCEHEIKQLTVFYQDEIGAKFGVEPRKATVEQLYALAKTNPSIAEEISREKKRRDVNTVIWTAAAVVSMGVGAFFIGAGAAVGAMIGVSAFYLSEKILDPTLKRAFDVDKPTVVDRIHNLAWIRKKQQRISHAQVMDVYVAANSSLQSLIHDRHGTRDFMELDAIDQRRMMLQFGEDFGLEDVTQAINERRMNARELTFRVHGDVSGAAPDPAYRTVIGEKLSKAKQHGKQKAADLKQSAAQRYENVRDNTQQMRETASSRFSSLQENAQNFTSRFRPKGNEAEAVSEGVANTANAEASTSQWENYITQRRDAQVDNQIGLN